MLVNMFHVGPVCRTDTLLLKLSLLVGQQVFYGALWGTMLVSPIVRLPASVFIVTHFDRMVSIRQQTHMLGYDHRLVVSCNPEINIYGLVVCLVNSPELVGFCLSSGEVGLSFSARFKSPRAEEHARNPALLFPLC